MLKVKDLEIKYFTDEGVVEAVNGISFHIDKGEIIGIVGETGAGKTSTARAILNLVQKPVGKITNGSINFQNQDIVSMKEDELQKIRGNKISMIFQDPMTALNPRIKVENQIAEVIYHHRKISKKESITEARKVLETVGIDPKRGNEYPNQFSGGMKQRVVIAIALALNPQLLIADEPTTALDVTIQAQILQLMKEIYKDKEDSLILISHDLGVIAKMCSRVYVMYAGEIVESGTTYDIFENYKHPYTEGLFNSIPSLDKKDNELIPIFGDIPDPTDLPKGCKFHPRCKYATDECKKGKVENVKISNQHYTRCIHLAGGKSYE